MKIIIVIKSTISETDSFVNDCKDDLFDYFKGGKSYSIKREKILILREKKSFEKEKKERKPTKLTNLIERIADC